MDTDADELGNELCAAALAGDQARARLLLAAGARADHAFIGDEFLRGDMHEHLCWPGNTPLAEAIRAGNAAMIRLLVEAGADPNGPVAATFGSYPRRVKDRPLTWWMRFALEYQIDDEGGQGQATIQSNMEASGRMLLAVGADPELGAITYEGSEGQAMNSMMAREGLTGALDRMRAGACQDDLGRGTIMSKESEKAIDRL